MGPRDPTPQTWGEDVVDGEFTETEPKLDEAQWLKDIDGAFSSVAGDMIDLGKEQEKVMTPMKGKVSDATWTEAKKILMRHFQRITGRP